MLVQEYAGRGDLYGIYRSLNRRMTEAQLTCLVLTPFMEALSYLHSRGICHRWGNERVFALHTALSSPVFSKQENQGYKVEGNYL